MPEYPFEAIEQHVSEEFKKKFSEKLYYRKSIPVETLSYHDLFKQLSGNPTSIVILAKCYSNPFFKFNSLAQLYKKVLDQRSLTEDESDYDVRSEVVRPVISKNNFSLNFTIEASLGLLEQLADDKSKPELA